MNFCRVDTLRTVATQGVTIKCDKNCQIHQFHTGQFKVRFIVTSSSSDSKQTYRWHVLNEEEQHETVTKFETTPWKRSTQPSQQMCGPVSLPQYTTKLLQLHPYTCVIHKHYKTDQEPKLNFLN